MRDGRTTHDGAAPSSSSAPASPGRCWPAISAAPVGPLHVYEKRPDPRLGPPERGRSINLALSVRGIHALREVGLADEVLRDSVLMRGRMIHARDGALTFQPYGKDDNEALHSVSRGGLNRLLVEAAARHESVRLFFNHSCTGLDAHGGAVEFLDDKQRRPPYGVPRRSSAPTGPIPPCAPGCRSARASTISRII